MGASGLHSPAYRRFRQLLRKWRTEAGLTQRAMAERLRKPHSFVHKCEAGERRVDPLEFVAWCVACDREPAASITQVQQEAMRGAG